MPMSRAKKVTHLEELEGTLARAKGSVFANFSGMKVKETEELRRTLREQGASVRVTKNTILRIALQRKGIAIDESILAQPLVLVASPDDEVLSAKVLSSFRKDHEALKIVGGLISDQFLTEAETIQLAKLPSRDELRAQLVGMIAAPLTGFLRTLQAPVGGLVNVLHQYQAKKA